jgi:hypothetical protein
MIEVRHRSVRAVSLDEDRGNAEVLDGYVFGEHVLDALRRIAIALQATPRTRAFSVTGPYGSGKSSFALLLSALLASKGDPAHRRAGKLLRGADAQLAASAESSVSLNEAWSRRWSPAVARQFRRRS